MTIDIYNDIPASVASFRRQFTEHPGMIKISEDLDRYERVIADTKPELLIETGTYHGGSAAWFAQRVPQVVTIDTAPHVPPTVTRAHPNIEWITGSSTDREIVDSAWAWAIGRTTMVVLDSDHSFAHVRDEIKEYGPLVTPGCYLVVEDTLIRWLRELYKPSYAGSPLDAVEVELVGNSAWERDTDTEKLHPISQYPAGWWRRARA